MIFLIPPCLCCFYVACRMHQLCVIKFVIRSEKMR
jgi:hypothetical protein